MGSTFTLSIDWLAFTVLAATPQETLRVLGGDWSKAKGGFRGYPLSWIRTDGLRGVGKLGTHAPRRPNEIHVDLSGGLAPYQEKIPVVPAIELLRSRAGERSFDHLPAKKVQTKSLRSLIWLLLLAMSKVLILSDLRLIHQTEVYIAWDSVAL